MASLILGIQTPLTEDEQGVYHLSKVFRFELTILSFGEPGSQG